MTGVIAPQVVDELTIISANMDYFFAVAFLNVTDDHIEFTSEYLQVIE